MGVRVTTSQYNHGDKGDVRTQHVFEEATSWTHSSYGVIEGASRIVLEITREDEEGDDLVVAAFSDYDFVELIDE